MTYVIYVKIINYVGREYIHCTVNWYSVVGVHMINDSIVKVLYQMKSNYKKIVILFVVSFMVLWEMSDAIIRNIKVQMLPENALLIITGPTEYVMARLQVSVITGALVTIPLVIVFLYAKGLFGECSKKRFAVWSISFLVLLLSGFFLTYNFILPSAIYILTTMTMEAGVDPLFSLSYFVNFIILALVIFSFSFEFPLLIVWLVSSRIVSAKTLQSRRREIYVVVFVMTAIITADPTPVSQVLLSFPLIILFEGSLLVSSKLIRGGI